MCYVNKMEYRIVPTESFKIRRVCAGCGGKQIFASKQCFRVNANGNKLDVWMIYGCEKCSHTYNLPIYERINPAKLSRSEYDKYLANDEELLFQIGTDKSVFSKNKAEIARDQIRYEIVPQVEEKKNISQGKLCIRVENEYNIPVRADKIVAEILNITRSEAKRLLHNENVAVETI